MKNCIYVDANDIGKLLKGMEVEVPDSPIVISMLNREEMKEYFHFTDDQIFAEIEKRKVYCKDSVLEKRKAEIIAKLMGLKTHMKRYVSLDDVLGIINGK